MTNEKQKEVLEHFLDLYCDVYGSLEVIKELMEEGLSDDEIEDLGFERPDIKFMREVV